MHTQSIQWEHCNAPSVAGPRGLAASLYRAMDAVMSYLTGMVVACATIVAAALAINDPGLVLYLQVAVWTGSLVFLGLAIEAERPSTAWMAVVTGLAMQALAFSSRGLGAELLVVAAALVAAWLAAGLFQATRTASR